MDISDYLINIFPKGIATEIIIYGFIYFLLLFYGTEQWEKKYSGFEKVVFSAMTGGVVWYFFIQPISIILAILKVFQYGLLDINYNISQQESLFFILCFYLIIWRLASNKPLRDNDHFFHFNKFFISNLIIFILFIYIILSISILINKIENYLQYCLWIIYYLVNLILFFIIFLQTYEKNIPLISDIYLKLILTVQKIKSKLSISKISINYIIYLIIFSIMISIIYVTYITETQYQLKDQKNTRLEIQSIDLRENNENLTGFLDVEQNYTIFFRHLPWIKFKPNISLINEYGIPYNTESNYNISGEYIFVNGTSWKTVNISLKGRKYETNLQKIYEIEKKDVNETVQIWNIRFFNQYDNPIRIHQIVIGNNEKLKLLDFKTYLLGFDVEKFEEKIQNQQNSTLTIDELSVWDNYISSNHSITLIFEKTK